MEYCREYFWYYKYSTMIFIFSVFEHGPTSTNYDPFIEGSLEVKLPTIWRDEKAVSREKSQKRKDQKKEDAGARKGRKVAKHCVFSWFCGSGGLKSRLAKAAGAETSGEMRDEKLHAVVVRSTFPSQNVQNTPGSDHFWQLRCRKSAPRCGAKHISTKHTILGPLLEVEMSKKCTPLWREAHFQVKMYKTRQVRTTFGSWDVEKVHAVVARSTFPSQNVQNTPFSDHFWKLRCRKSARRCGAKHISKSKCTKHARFGPLLEVEMSKKCTPLWREAHFQVKMYKTHQVRTTFGSWDVEKVHAVVARSTFPSQNVQNTPGSDHFWKLRCRKSARCCGAKQISKSKCTKHTQVRTTFGSWDVEKVHAVVARSTFRSQNVQSTWGFGPLLEVQMSLRFASGHYTTLYTPLNYSTLHYTTLHNTTTTTTELHNYTPLHSTTLNYNTLRHITLHYATLHYTPLHYTTLHYTIHSTTLHYITLHYTLHTLQYITLHYTPQHYNYNYRTTQLHSTTLHYTPLH